MKKSKQPKCNAQRMWELEKAYWRGFGTVYLRWLRNTPCLNRQPR